MPKLKSQPRVRDVLVAKSLLEGSSQTKAVLAAGYSRSTAKKAASKICGSPQVVAALREIGRSIRAEDLDELARARLQGLLSNPDTDFRSLAVAIRLGLEVSGKVGAGACRGPHYLDLSPETKAWLEQLRKEKQLADAKVTDAGLITVPSDMDTARQTLAVRNGESQEIKAPMLAENWKQDEGKVI